MGERGDQLVFEILQEQVKLRGLNVDEPRGPGWHLDGGRDVEERSGAACGDDAPPSKSGVCDPQDTGETPVPQDPDLGKMPKPHCRNSGGTPEAQLRMRRLDRHCFVLERRSGAGWAVEGYYNTPAAMCRAAIRCGIVGDTAAELLASVEAAEARAMDALLQAVTSGALSKGAGAGRGCGAVGRPKTAEKKDTGATGADLERRR